MRRVFYFSLILVLNGCIFMPDLVEGRIIDQKRLYEAGVPLSIQPPPPDDIFTGTETVYQRNYVLNERMIARVGEPVMRVKAFRKQNFVKSEMILENEVTVTSVFENFTLKPKAYPIFGMIELERVPYFVLEPIKNVHLMVDMSGVLQTSLLYDIRDSDKVQLLTDKVKFEPKNPYLVRQKISRESKLPFTDYEVVYDGIKDNQISLFHKYAVPGTKGEKGSFDTYTYPADSTMISVEGALIRIIRADPEQIEYIVMKNP